jgi:hypothetical protein
LNREGNKRFAPLASKPESFKGKPLPASLIKKESFEDRFKIEKDSRKKTSVETKTTSKPGPSYSTKNNTIAHKPINTTDVDPIEQSGRATPNNESEEKEIPIKTEHGVTLCKKKHAKEVLMAKIKRKEIEKQQKTTSTGNGTSENPNGFNNKEKPIETLCVDNAVEKKTLNLNDPIVKKECKGLSQRIFWRKMENDLNQFTDNIAAECKRMKVFRLCVYDRIEFMVSKLFEKFGAHIKMYGSCVTGTIFFEIFQFFMSWRNHNY